MLHPPTGNVLPSPLVLSFDRAKLTGIFRLLSETATWCLSQWAWWDVPCCDTLQPHLSATCGDALPHLPECISLSSEQHCQETPSSLHSRGYAGWPKSLHAPPCPFMSLHLPSRNTVTLPRSSPHLPFQVSGLGSESQAEGIHSGPFSAAASICETMGTLIINCLKP